MVNKQTKKIPFTLLLSSQQIKDLKTYQALTGTSVSEQIRRAIDYHLDNNWSERHRAIRKKIQKATP